MHGGLSAGDTWLYRFNEERWEDITKTLKDSPGVRHGPLMVSDAAGNALLFGGGRVQPMNLFNDLWMFSASRLQWEQLVPSRLVLESTPLGRQPQPMARNYLSGAYLNDFPGLGALLLIHGGANCTGRCRCMQDTWVYSFRDGDWMYVPSFNEPDTRYHQSMALMSDNSLYMFGGESYQPVYMYHNSVERLRLHLGAKPLLRQAMPGLHQSQRYNVAAFFVFLSFTAVVFVTCCSRRRRLC